MADHPGPRPTPPSAFSDTYAGTRSGTGASRADQGGPPYKAGDYFNRW